MFRRSQIGEVEDYIMDHEGLGLKSQDQCGESTWDDTIAVYSMKA